MRARNLFGLVVIASLSACATNPYEPEVTEAGTQAPIEREQDESAEAEPSQPPAAERATATLLASAKQASVSGRHGEAINYLERAVRMQPRDPKLWTNLAAAYLANEELVNATRHVRKAIALAESDDVAAQQAWLTLADIKEAQGEVSEARSIRRQWRKLRG